MTSKNLNWRQALWSLYLSRFDFTLHHRPGTSMGKADALSRRPDHGDGSNDNRDITLLDAKYFAVHALQVLAMDGDGQKVLKAIRKAMRRGEAEKSVVEMISKTGSKRFRSNEWRKEGKFIMF